MLCESCNENDATIHLTQVVDGAVKKLHLCEDCAAKSGFDVHGPMSVTDMLLGIGGQDQDAVESVSAERSCPRCHMRRSDFKKTSRLGCPDCYEHFSEELPPLLKAMHRSEQHVGKIPAKEGIRVRMSAEIAALKKALDEAVSGEKFEEAARLRDEIQNWRLKVEESESDVGS